MIQLTSSEFSHCFRRAWMGLYQLGGMEEPFHLLDYNPNHESAELYCEQYQRTHRVTVISSRFAMVEWWE